MRQCRSCGGACGGGFGNRPCRYGASPTTPLDPVRQARWDRRYLDLARVVGSWSKDPSTKVGAVLVRPNNSVASTGFNGFPPGHDDSPELYQNREYKYQHVVHAEVNALNFFGQTATGFTLYTSFPCCPDCVKYAARLGVVRIVSTKLLDKNHNSQWVEEWLHRMGESKMVAQQHRIALELIDV